jgi:hypothetical protein
MYANTIRPRAVTWHCKKHAAKTRKYLNADGLMSWNATTLSSCGQKQKFARLVRKSKELLAFRSETARGRCTERSRGERWWSRGRGRRCRRTRTSQPSAPSSPRGRGSRTGSSWLPLPPVGGRWEDAAAVVGDAGRRRGSSLGGRRL